MRLSSIGGVALGAAITLLGVIGWHHASLWLSEQPKPAAEAAAPKVIPALPPAHRRRR